MTERKSVDRPCAVDGCASVVGPKGSKGMCRFHYRRVRSHGDPHKRFSDRDCVLCSRTFQPDMPMQQRCQTCKTDGTERTLQMAYNREWRAKHPTYHAEYNKRWRAENPEEYKAYATAYRAANYDLVRERFKAWEVRNPNHSRDWTRANREQSRASVQRYRARKRAATVCDFTADQLSQRWAYYGNKCWTCGGVATATDHVKPLNKGGPHMLANLRPICGACNSSKSDYWPLSEWPRIHQQQMGLAA